MAKKITDTNETTSEVTPVPEQTEEIKPTETVKVEEQSTKTAKEDKKPKVEKGQDTIPDYADKILKVFTNYEQLYIDFHGCTFTTDTPPAFRSDATLYENPYYKKP